MRAGKLDRTIVFQSSTPSVDGFGEPIDAWSTFATVPAAIIPNRGSERFAEQQVIGRAVVTFKIRYRTDVNVESRIVYDSKNWDIHDVRQLGRREGLEVDASARSEP